jgi:TPR repeat protein/predicted Ser/Thr protein kinase
VIGSIGHYELLEELGRGAMGVVYRARASSGEVLALKVMALGKCSNAERAARFEREVKVLQRLEHPGLIQLVDAGEDQGRRWFATRLVEGESLDAVLARGPLPVEEAIALGTQLAEALLVAHAVGVIHRDVKPGNVIVSGPKRYVLSDFGLTRDLEIEESQRLSQTGVAVGTPGYWSPEQAAGQPVSFSTDVYGVGATLFAALAGEAPCSGSSFFECVVAARELPPRPLRSLRPDTPPWLEVLVARCLLKQPQERYPDMKGLLVALYQGPGRGRGAGTGGVPSRVALGAGSLALLAGLLGLFAAAGGETTSASPPVAQASPTAPDEPHSETPSPPKAIEIGTYEEALLQLWEWQGDLARPTLEALALEGKRNAQVALGVLLIEGYGGERDLDAGVGWLRKAAGEPGGETSLSAARALLRFAALANDREAMTWLGVWHLQGVGGGTSPTLARRWLSRAAEAGSLEGTFRLAELQDRGAGGVRNKSAAERGYRLAARRGHCAGMRAYSHSLEDSRLKKLWRERWKERAEEQIAAGSPRAMCLQGWSLMHSSGATVRNRGMQLLLRSEKRYPLASYYVGDSHEKRRFGGANTEAMLAAYRRGAAAGSPRCIRALGWLQLKDRGLGIPVDPARALERYREAAAHGHHTSMNDLGQLLAKGKHTPKDLVGARAWYERAVGFGNDRARTGLADLLLKGLGGPSDPKRACLLLKDAAEDGHEAASRHLARIYEQGLGVPVDLVEAMKWHRFGANQGSTRSRLGVARFQERGLGGARDERGARANYRYLVGLKGKAARWEAHWRLGRMLETGRGGAPDQKEAASLYEEARNKQTPAAFHWARCLEKGIGVSVNLGKAATIYRKAARKGYAPAMLALANLLEGPGASHALDPQEAGRWREKAKPAPDTHDGPTDPGGSGPR